MTPYKKRNFIFVLSAINFALAIKKNKRPLILRSLLIIIFLELLTYQDSNLD